MNAASFEHQFSWLKTYAHELREAAETLEEEGDLFKNRASRALREKGPVGPENAVVAALLALPINYHFPSQL